MELVKRLLDNLQIRQLVDWTTRRLDILRTGQLADATGDFACLVFVLLLASERPRVVQSAENFTEIITGEPLRRRS